MGKGVVIRIVRFLVQTPPGTQPHLVTQPCYEAPSDLWVKIEKNELLTLVSEAVTLRMLFGV